MAKKKKTKSTETKTFQYSVELNGLLLILIGLIGFGSFGPVGRIIKNFAIFLMGTWYVVFLFTILFLGLYMIIKRKMPKFFSARLLGFYILLISILMFSHLEYVTNADLRGYDIITTTVDDFMNTASDAAANVGGGIIGALFTALSTSLFDVNGTNIVIIVLAIFGIIMLFDITLGDIFSKLKQFLLFVKSKTSKEKEENEEDDDDDVAVIDEDEIDKYKIKNNEEENEDDDSSKVHSNATNYRLPPLDLLSTVKAKKTNESFINTNQSIIERVLKDFQIEAQVVNVNVGPSVSQFEIKIKQGVKVSKVVSVKDELKLALAVKDVRIQAPIPGKNTIGIEVPNPSINTVTLKDMLIDCQKTKVINKTHLLTVLGKDIMGHTVAIDISKMPHLLVAGSTGSGKSVCINCIIISLLMNYKPDELRLVLVDPKQVELTAYNKVQHLLYPVVTDPKDASMKLKGIVAEMDKRYKLLSKSECKDIVSYNEIRRKELKKHPDSNEYPEMPYIVVIIDELADLMLIAAKEVEDSIMRITQLARAAGIHLIVATQRPSTDVITGIIKANIPSRISFAVSSAIDSRTILDASGAERLIGKGDMLYLPMGENVATRIQGAMVPEEDIKRIISFIASQEVVAQTYKVQEVEDHMAGNNHDEESYDDPLYNEIVEFTIKTGKVSASLLQRRFRLGYNRAARIVDLLEERGIVGPPNGSKPREVLIKVDKKENE